MLIQKLGTAFSLTWHQWIFSRIMESTFHLTIRTNNVRMTQATTTKPLLIKEMQSGRRGKHLDLLI